jgi:hypothetical protein
MHTPLGLSVNIWHEMFLRTMIEPRELSFFVKKFDRLEHAFQTIMVIN